MAVKRNGFPPDTVEENGNLPKVFLNRASIFADKKALFYKVHGHYTGYYTWREWITRVRDTAMAIHSLGIRKSDHVGIFSENCPEWTFADLGCLCLGAVVVPIYPNSSEEDIRHIIEHARIKAVFVANDAQYQKILPYQSMFLPGGISVFSSKEPKGDHAFLSWLDKGRQYGLNHTGLFEQCVAHVGPDDLATIIYTSGTTGTPKGVMLTHRNLIANYQGSFQRIQIDETDSVLSFLPLSHSFERLAGYYFQAAYGVSIAYAENMTTVAEDIKKVRPTIVIAVPRFYEKMYVRIHEEAAKAPKWKRRIFEWAKRIAMRTAQMRIRKQQVPLRFFLLDLLAKCLILHRIKDALGGRIRFFVSGGAPLSKAMANFFYAIGVMILEGYGLTETAPVIAVNALDDFKFGTVGKVIPNIRAKIAEDGEILTAGPCVMKGYFNDPEATAGCLKEGWFHTGDIGHFDEDGFLHITDRKKDIIVTAGGKNISPQKIENSILQDNLFSQVVVLGDKRPYLCALIVPHKEAVLQFASQHEWANLSYEEMLRHPVLNQWIRERLEAKMEGLANYETVKAFILLAREFSQGSGEMTPTQKIKRRVVMKEYQKEIDDLYCKTDQEWFNRKTVPVPR
ncbi:MAG TPA: long-chain fatty acid--CoA ligase [Candidatus Omnitrophota bacterium]|nr:long-chain fatty acid--CoA ligase [Candidatus Omnitrophota bacterium]